MSLCSKLSYSFSSHSKQKSEFFLWLIRTVRPSPISLWQHHLFALLLLDWLSCVSLNTLDGHTRPQSLCTGLPRMPIPQTSTCNPLIPSLSLGLNVTSSKRLSSNSIPPYPGRTTPITKLRFTEPPFIGQEFWNLPYLTLISHEDRCIPISIRLEG